MFDKVSGCIRRLQEFTGRIRRNQLVYQREESLLDHGHISGDIVEHTIQSKKDRHLDDQLYAAACRADAVLTIHLFDLILLSLHGLGIFAVFILFVDLVELRLHFSLELGEFLLLDRKRQHGHVDQNGHDDDGQTDIGNSNLIEHIENAVHTHSQ